VFSICTSAQCSIRLCCSHVEKVKKVLPMPNDSDISHHPPVPTRGASKNPQTLRAIRSVPGLRCRNNLRIPVVQKSRDARITSLVGGIA